MELTAAELATATNGELLTGSAAIVATSFAIDSRELRRGACFIAVRGERDGHDFVGDAFRHGATVGIVERAVEDVPAGVAVIRVPSTMGALADLARFARSRVPHAVVVGITGSAGKTATKDLAAAALARGRRVHASPMSFNNEAGVPLTLLGALLDTEVIVTEMGARFPGNIAELTELTQPRVGVVTNIGLAHAGLLGGRSGIARVKGELLEALPPEGIAVLNDECDESRELATRTRARVVRVGSTTRAEVRTSRIELDPELRPSFVLETPSGRAEVALELRGEHQVQNAAQAAAVALELGVPIEEVAAGLADARAAAHRMELLRTAAGVVVLNDAYNSSPTAAAAAVRSLARLDVPGRRVAVLGEMRELGEHSDAEHAALGVLAAEAGVDVLVVVGESGEQVAEAARARGVAVLITPDPQSAAMLVANEVRPGDAVLVKASRAVGLEQVAHALLHGGGAS